MEEMQTLKDWLDENGFDYYYDDKPIPFASSASIQVIVYKMVDGDRLRSWDAIWTPHSFGYEEGLLEIRGDIVEPGAGDSVEGWLTANDIIKRLEQNK